jgi:hypothetical protein
MDMKKFKIIILAFASALMLVVPMSYSAGANSQQSAAAGSREDPIVTASYVARAIEVYMERNGGAAYELVELTQNQRIRASSGTLELIVRPGSQARITSPHRDIGLADLTTGQELLSGDIVPVNHMLLIARADQRGLVILSERAWILVRGDYEIE